ncbi:MAG: presqualene diphosphate synthase HpnD [Xanthomonadaceae bacterium]|nr:presqualene diphosphate synthase HpnD [Xanthomonadaceae bacterium]
MTPEQYCQEKTATSRSSFYHAFQFLPARERAGITALYAFCREVDDVVDNVREEEVARAKLDWWRSEVDRLFAGAPQHPVTRALAEVRERVDLQPEYFHEILDGMQMDLDHDGYETFSELQLYCWRAAGVVGLLSAAIFGYDDRGTERYAQELGIAFQLTNIIRDVGEDAQRGRVYLAREDLARHGVGADELTADTTSPALAAVLKEYAERARGFYRKAYAALPDGDRYRQRSGLMMAAIYERLLDRLERDGFHVLERRVSLNPLHKLWLAWRTASTEERRHRRALRG